MGVTVVNPGKVIPANECTIGKTYRRASQPTKFYLCIRRIDDNGQATNEGRLVSLSHGNTVSLNLNLPDFVQVRLTATSEDVL